MSRPSEERTHPIVDTPATFLIASEGQLTMAKALHQPLGLSRGSRERVEPLVDHIALRPWRPRRPNPSHGLPMDDAGVLSGPRPGDDG